MKDIEIRITMDWITRPSQKEAENLQKKIVDLILDEQKWTNIAAITVGQL